MFNWVADAVTAICVATIFAVVVANFLQAEPGRTFRERRSPVATLTMAAFFVLLYATIRLRWGMVAESGFVIGRSIGLALVVVGTAFNVWGRLHLGANWADHVRIYANQTLVTGGPYRVVRHPLYASLLWMFGVFAAALSAGATRPSDRMSRELTRLACMRGSLEAR